MAELTGRDGQNTAANRLEITRGFGHCRLAGSDAKLPSNGFVGLPESTRLIDKIGRKNQPTELDGSSVRRQRTKNGYDKKKESSEMKRGKIGIATGFVLTLGLAMAGCTRIELSSFNAPKFSDQFRLPTVSASAPVGTLGPARAEDMVDAQGNCASAPMASAAAGVEASSTDPVTVPPNAAQALGGIGLQMTECDVVKRAGAPENMELGTNPNGERKLTLTYIHGARPGIYGFVAGRLTSINRAPEPPEAPKPAKPAKSAKPKPKPKPAAT